MANTSSKKSKKNQSSWRSNIVFMISQCAIALVVIIVLLFIFHSWLNKQTEHGVEVEVPQITGLSIEEAQMLLKGNRLQLQVIDSTYSHKVPLGTIVDQMPAAQSMAKTNRVVYVVVNARQKRQVMLPELIDVSQRQAETLLRQQGLRVDSIEYEPSAYRGLVLDVRRNMMSVPAGTRLEEGTGVTLVVGMGLGEGKVAVPDLNGQTFIEARSLLLANRLIIGSAVYEAAADSAEQATQVVYRQHPVAGEQLQEGQTVNIWLSSDLERAATADNEQKEEDFF
jgi:beta-lactam-binding protein with PASTA domain